MAGIIHSSDEISRVDPSLVLQAIDAAIFIKSRLNDIYHIIIRSYEAGRTLITDRRVTRSQTIGKAVILKANGNSSVDEEDDEENDDDYGTSEGSSDEYETPQENSDEEYWSDESYVPSDREEEDDDEDIYEHLNQLEDEMEIISQFAQLHLDKKKDVNSK